MAILRYGNAPRWAPPAVIALGLVLLLGVGAALGFYRFGATGWGGSAGVIAVQGRNTPGFGVTLYAPQALPTNPVLTVAEQRDGPATELHLIDAATGKTIAAITTAYKPMAVFRRTRSELLVSDIVFDMREGQATAAHPRLFVLDL